MPASRRCWWCENSGALSCWIDQHSDPVQLCDKCVRLWASMIRPIDADEVSGYKRVVLNRIAGIKGKRA